jgi:hypothetical protein
VQVLVVQGQRAVMTKILPLLDNAGAQRCPLSPAAMAGMFFNIVLIYIY